MLDTFKMQRSLLGVGLCKRQLYEHRPALGRGAPWGGRWAATVQGRLEVAFVQVSCWRCLSALCSNRKELEGAVKDLRGAQSCSCCPHPWGGPSDGDRQEAVSGRGKGNSSFNFVIKSVISWDDLHPSHKGLQTPGLAHKRRFLFF